MAFVGEILDACGIIDIDFSNTYVVAVSGDGPNVCGHLLVCAGNRGGYYFHVAELHGYPRYMNEAGYRQYLRESGKIEVRRRRIELPSPNGALLYLEGLLAEKWTWLVVPNNCVTFVEEVIRAGGGSWGSHTNCPAVATALTVSERAQTFYNWMESGIYNLYGVPRY
jgi:hypothetical protein